MSSPIFTRIAAYFTTLYFYYIVIVPYVFEPYEFSTEINALIQLKKPYPKSYRKPRIASFMAAKHAIVVPVWSDSFVLPSLVLFRSLRLYGTHLDLIVLVPTTSDTTDVKNNYFDNTTPLLSSQNLKAFETLDVKIKKIDPIEINRERLKSNNQNWSKQFLKLYAWTLIDYEKILLLDADTLAVTNIDDIFESCPGDRVCGTKNPGRIPTSRLQGKIGMSRYINGGFILLKPDMRLFDDMVNSIEKSKTCCRWAFEQDFFNWYFWGYNSKDGDDDHVNKEITVLKSGHYNTYPASHLIHFVKGKPWYWWAYPIPVIGAPIGHVWAAAEGVSSIQWVYIRGTMPQGFLGGYGTQPFLLLTLYPLIVVFYIMHCVPVTAITSIKSNKTKDVVHHDWRVKNSFIQDQRTKQLGTSNRASTSSSTRTEYFKYFCICNFIVWFLIFVCVGRDCFINLTIVPNRLQPHLAWSFIALLSSCTSYFVLHLLTIYFSHDEPDMYYVVRIISSRFYSFAYLFGIFLSILIGISVIIVLRFFVYNINSFLVWVLFISWYIFVGNLLFHILVNLQKFQNGVNNDDESSSLPKYA
jgi:hypothetical protein